MAMDFSLTYGDDSSAERPLSIQAADIHFEAVPSLRIVLITMRLTIVNDAVCRDIEAALRFPLPDSDALVCGFELDGIAAISVPKAKAAEITYKEKEKGRAVATAAAVQGAVYEVTIFPLLYNEPKQLTLSCFTKLEPDEGAATLAVCLPLTFASAVSSVIVGAHATEGAVCIETDSHKAEAASSILPPTTLGATALPNGVTLRITLSPPSDGSPDDGEATGEVVSALGSSGGSERHLLYWSARLSADRLDRALRGAMASRAASSRAAAAMLRSGSDPSAPHLGLFIDCSLSSAPTAASTLAILEAIGAAHEARAAHAASYSVWSFNHVTQQLTSRATLSEALTAIRELRYEGNTDLRLLNGLLEQASVDEEGARCDVVLLLTGEPTVSTSLNGLGAGHFPVHVPLPDSGTTANLAVLKWIAYQLGGSTSIARADSAAVAALAAGAAPHLLLTQLTIDLQDDLDAFEDPTLHTVPDFRLARVSHATEADGSMRVSGVCSLAYGSRAPPTTTRLTVSRGRHERAWIELPIPAPQVVQAEAVLAEASTAEAQAETAEAATAEAALAAGTAMAHAHAAALGRLLEVQHARLMIADPSRWLPAEFTAHATKVATCAGLASEDSSLLLLSLPEQFREYELEGGSNTQTVPKRV